MGKFVGRLKEKKKVQLRGKKNNTIIFRDKIGVRILEEN